MDYRFCLLSLETMNPQRQKLQIHHSRDSCCCRIKFIRRTHQSFGSSQTVHFLYRLAAHIKTGILIRLQDYTCMTCCNETIFVYLLIYRKQNVSENQIAERISVAVFDFFFGFSYYHNGMIQEMRTRLVAAVVYVVDVVVIVSAASAPFTRWTLPLSMCQTNFLKCLVNAFFCHTPYA